MFNKKVYVVMGGWNHEGYCPMGMKWFTDEMEAETYAESLGADDRFNSYNYVDIFVSVKGQEMKLLEHTRS